jgi:hypothetical protein
MADMAMFPLNEVTDDGAGNGQAEQCSREQYLAQMAEVMGGSGDDVTMESTRTPHFIADGLVFVITEGAVTYEGQTYGDLLVKKDGSGCSKPWSRAVGAARALPEPGPTCAFIEVISCGPGHGIK